jgi:hypothetical protein
VQRIIAYPYTARRRGWSKLELLYFHSAATALWKTGLPVEIDGGLTDEGDPWFVCCDARTGEVFVHFARINGRYIACTSLFSETLTARALPNLIARFINRCPRNRMASLKGHSKGGRVVALGAGSVSRFLPVQSMVAAKRPTQKSPLT